MSRRLPSGLTSGFGLLGGLLLIYGFALFGYQLVYYLKDHVWVGVTLFDPLSGLNTEGPAAWASSGSPLVPAWLPWLETHPTVRQILQFFPLALSAIVSGLLLILLEAIFDARREKP